MDKIDLQLILTTLENIQGIGEYLIQVDHD